MGTINKTEYNNKQKEGINPTQNTRIIVLKGLSVPPGPPVKILETFAFCLIPSVPGPEPPKCGLGGQEVGPPGPGSTEDRRAEGVDHFGLFGGSQVKGDSSSLFKEGLLWGCRLPDFPRHPWGAPLCTLPALSFGRLRTPRRA